MTRPNIDPSTLVNGQEAWDAVLRDLLGGIVSNPFPPAEYATPEDLPAASSFEGCVASVATPRHLYFSDGTAWVDLTTGAAQSGYGSYSMHDNATVTTIASVDTPVKVAGTTLVGASIALFTHADNRLTYTGPTTHEFMVTAVGAVTAANNKALGIYIAKNGTPIGESEMYVTGAGTTALVNWSTQHLVEMATNDYVEIWVENETDATDVTFPIINVIADQLD